MINLDEYFCVWKQRLAALKGSFCKIRILPNEAQFLQALFVRNSCLDFILELELAFETILSDYMSRQDEFFLSAMDDMHMLAFNRKSWPFNSDVLVRLSLQKKELMMNVKLWALQAADFEASIMLVQEGYKREVYALVGELSVTYGVSPRIRKKRKP